MIRLIKVSKTTGKKSEEFYKDYVQLEKKISKISTAYYQLSDYFIVSDDFKGMVEHFIEVYNEDYFTINNSLKAIQIHKMGVGGKRKKENKGGRMTRKQGFYRAMTRLEEKFGVIYDKEMAILTLSTEENKEKIIFDIDEENMEVESISYNEVEASNFKETVSKTKEIINYLIELKKRYERREKKRKERLKK